MDPPSFLGELALSGNQLKQLNPLLVSSSLLRTVYAEVIFQMHYLPSDPCFLDRGIQTYTHVVCWQVCCTEGLCHHNVINLQSLQ